MIARLLVDGRPRQLVCEYKSNGQPRYARSALLELRNHVAHRAPQATPVFIAPYISPAVTGTHYFFADDEGLRELQGALKLTPTSKGENVVVTVPKDLGLLADTVEPAPGAVCTSTVQTCLDLSIAGERGAEAADHLRRERLSWPK